MTHDELNSLWREAGRPWVQGMQCGSYVVDAVYNGKSYVDDGEYALEGDPTPDWGNPMVEFALMCAAEQAAGCRLEWLRNGDSDTSPWLAYEMGNGMRFYAMQYGTRVECALRVIIACQEAGDAAR